MGRLTFVVGNGLDLSLGLASKYSQFYEHVTHAGLFPDNKIFKAIQQSQEDWSDFESALGTYTEYLNGKSGKELEKETDIFLRELEEIINELSNYLKAEAAKITLIPESFRLDTTGYLEGLNDYTKRKITSSIEVGSSIVYDIVTLNYTYTLEEILTDQSQMRRFGYERGELLHVHGTVDEAMTLGVSDESQLFVDISPRLKSALIKRNLITSLNDGRIDQMSEIIADSNVIVLFGTSIGTTDNYIWRDIVDWLFGSQSRYVVIHAYDEQYTDGTKIFSPSQVQYTSTVIHRLLSSSGLDGNQIQAVQNQIFVIFNSKKLFYGGAS